MAKKKKDKVKPQLLKGFRDYPPAEQIAREEMIGRVREVFELMGFQPLQTASLEFAEALLGPHYSRDSLNELFGFLSPKFFLSLFKLLPCFLNTCVGCQPSTL